MMVKEGRVERFLLLPFSLGCDSQSSVAVATTAAVSSEYSKTGERRSEQNLTRIEVKKNEGFWKASIFSQGFHRLIKGFKSFSQFFVYKEELEEEEKEIEIGFPTDVKHVTHIGLDGSTTVINPIPHSNWETLNPAPSISLQQFQLAMAAQPQPNAN